MADSFLSKWVLSPITGKEMRAQNVLITAVECESPCFLSSVHLRNKCFRGSSPYQ